MENVAEHSIMTTLPYNHTNCVQLNYNLIPLKMHKRRWGAYLTGVDALS